jgi:hypothetical protein
MRAGETAPERAGEARGPASSKTATMPDVLGKPLRPALVMLAPLPADVELDGTGVVVSQVPTAGMPVSAGDVVHLTLARPALSGARAATPPARVIPAVAQGTVPPAAITKVGRTE